MPDLSTIRRAIPARIGLENLDDLSLSLLYRALNTERNIITMALKKSGRSGLSRDNLRNQLWLINDMLKAYDDETERRYVLKITMQSQLSVNSAKDLKDNA